MHIYVFISVIDLGAESGICCVQLVDCLLQVSSPELTQYPILTHERSRVILVVRIHVVS